MKKFDHYLKMQKFFTNEKSNMHRLANLILIFSLIVSTSNTSMQMFSIEKGRVFTEPYNISHLLTSSSNIPRKNPGLYGNPLTSLSICNHYHVLVLNKLSRDDSDIVRLCTNQASVVFNSYTFHVHDFLCSTVVLSDHSNSKLRARLPIIRTIDDTAGITNDIF